MFCTKCGIKMQEDSNYCPKCGAKQGKSEYKKVDYSNNQTFNMNDCVYIQNAYGVSTLKMNYMEIFKSFFIGMLLVVCGAYFGINYLPYSVINMMNILFLVFMIASVFLIKGNLVKNKVSMNIYCFILGIILSLTLTYYLGYLGYGVFFTCILGVSVIFGVAYWHASNSSEEEIFSTGPMLFKCMIALLIFEILNIFLFGFGLFDIVLSAAAIGIYSGYTLYTMKAMQVRCSNELLSEYEVVTISLALVTSFLNLLLHLLRLAAAIKSND